jgi:hypothetical protein
MAFENKFENEEKQNKKMTMAAFITIFKITFFAILQIV